MAHWQKNYRETTIGGVTTITHEGKRRGSGGHMKVLLKDYTRVAGCLVCENPSVAEIDEWLSANAAAGFQELGAIVRAFGIAFQARDLLAHIQHRTPEPRSAKVVNVWDTDGYRQRHGIADEPAPESAPTVPLLTVCAPLAGTRRVALWERDPAHPGGEVWVETDGTPATVARTPEVDRLMRAGALVEVQP
jgi:hypothetical protein